MLANCTDCGKELRQVYSAPNTDEPFCVACGEKRWKEWEKKGKI